LLGQQVSNEFAARFMFAAAAIPGNLSSMYLIETMGRRRLLCAGLLLAALFGFAFTATATPRLVRGGRHIAPFNPIV
jgi:hypothetical protein